MIESLLQKLTAEIARHNELAAERNALTRALLDAQMQRTTISIPVPPEAQQSLPLEPVAEPVAEPAVSYDELKVVVLEAVKTAGREAVQGVFKTLGVARAQELKPEQYGTALRAFRSLLQEETA